MMIEALFYTIIWYFFVLLAKNATEQLKLDFGFSRISLKYWISKRFYDFVLRIGIDGTMVHGTIQANILCRDARPSRFDQTSRHDGAIDKIFIQGNSNGTQHTAYTMIYETLSVVGTPYYFVNQCQHWRYSLFIYIRYTNMWYRRRVRIRKKTVWGNSIFDSSFDKILNQIIHFHLNIKYDSEISTVWALFTVHTDPNYNRKKSSISLQITTIGH